MKLFPVFLALCLFPAAAMANDVPDSRFLQDREFAVTQATSPQLQQQCLADFAHRANAGAVAPTGQLQFDERLTRIVYNAFYWKNSDRGVAFVLPIQKGETNAQLACFYSIAGNTLQFQLSQPLGRRS